MLSLLFLSGCLWSRAPGPVPVAEAEAPLRLVGQPVSGPITWLEVTVRAGSAHDPIGQEGLSWLTANLLAQGGAGGRSPEALADALYTLGTELSVVVDRELVSFRMRCLSEDLPQCADILGDVLLEPALDADVAARLRGQAREELESGLARNDEALGMAALETWMFTGHPYGHLPQGRAGVVDTLTAEDVQGFLARRYIRPAAALGVAGPMVTAAGDLAGEGAAAEAVSGLRSRLTAGLAPVLYADVTPRAVEAVSGRRLLVVEKDTAATGVHFGHPTALRRDHPDWPAMVLAATALGEHRQSHGRLYQALRGARGLNYGDYAYIEAYRQGGGREQETATGRVDNLFYVWLRPVTEDNGPFALKAAVALVEQFVEEGLTADELETMQAYLQGRVALRAASPGRRLGWSVEAAVMGWPDPIETLPAQVAALTLEEVNAAIRKHLRPEDLLIVAVTGDGERLAAGAGWTESGEKSGEGSEETPAAIVYAGDPPAAGSAQAGEDRRWATYDLNIAQVTLLTDEELFR